MTATRTLAARLALPALLASATLVVACGTTRKDEDQPDRYAGFGEEPQGLVRIADRTVGPVVFRGYEGAYLNDPRMQPAIDRLAAVVEPTLVAAENRAGVVFLPRRDAVVVLADDGVRRGGDVNMRLVDGMRRPVIRVPVPALLSGELLPGAHFRSLLVQAAVLASAGDRMPPAWLAAGLGPEITESFDRMLHERALGGPDVRTQATALFPPTPSDDDALRAAARVRALERIARGERPLARFVAARLSGASEVEALDTVGVQDPAFLEAASETERDRAISALTQGGPLEALSAVRRALEQGAPEKAVAQVSLIERELTAGAMSPWVDADARLTMAQYALVAGDLQRSRQLAAEALAVPRYLVRIREARICEARAARAVGDHAAAARLYRAYLTDFPDATDREEALAALGVDAELARALPGIAKALTSDDPRARGRAAVRLGESGKPQAAEPLRQLTGDDDADVRRLAYAALVLVAGPDAADDLDAGTRDPDAAVRGAALSTLAFADPARGEKRATELVDDDAPQVQVVVDRLLAPVRERALRDSAEAARRAAAAEAAEAAERIERERAKAETEKAAAAERARLARARREAEERKRREAEAAKNDTPPDPTPPRPPQPTPSGNRRDTPLPPPKPPRPLPAPKPDRDLSVAGADGNS